MTNDTNDVSNNVNKNKTDVHTNYFFLKFIKKTAINHNLVA